MVHHQVIDAARRNAWGPDTGRWLDELVACSARERHFGVHRAANAILHLMANARWWISSGPKRGGMGGGARPPDQTMHVTLAMRGQPQYHLRLDARGYVFQIVRGGEEATPPWLGPGQPVDG